MLLVLVRRGGDVDTKEWMRCKSLDLERLFPPRRTSSRFMGRIIA